MWYKRQGSTGNAGQANYAAAKAGLVGMSKALAQEVASRGITINVVAPGFIVTPMTDVLGEAQKTKLTEAIPLRRLGQPEDVAAAVAYLASDEAGWEMCIRDSFQSMPPSGET